MSPTPRTPSLPSDHLQPALRLARRALRFWRGGVMAFGITFAAAAAIAYAWPKQYRSEAVVYYREGMQWDSNERTGARRVGQRLRDQLLSRSQLAKIVEELGLYPKLVQAGRLDEAVEEMRVATDFRFDQSDIFVVSYTGDSPEQAQRVTAKLSDVLIGENTRLRAQQAELAREFLDAEKKRKGDELAAKEAEQLRFLAKHPEFAFEQGNAMGATLRARSSPGRDGPAVAALLREEQRLRRQLGSGPALSPQDAQLVAAKNEAEAKLDAARRELADRQNRFTEQHPDVRAAAAKVAEAEVAHRRALEALPAGLRSAPPVVRADVEERLERVRQEIAAARETPQAMSIPAPLLESSDTAKRIVAVETEWARLTREVAEARERLQRLDSQQFNASMTASMLTTGQSAQLVVIDPAYRPVRPIGMRLKKKFLIVVTLAFGVGIGLLVSRAVMDDLVYDAGDVERLDLAPVLAEVAMSPRRRSPEPQEARRAAGDGPQAEGGRTVTALLPKLAPRGGEPAGARPLSQEVRTSLARPAPEAPANASTALARVPEPNADATALRAPTVVPFASELSPFVRVHRLPAPRKDHRGIVMLEAPDSPAAASFRILRHRLAAHGDPKTILITSPGSGEGKTSTALNLALALGEGGGARVLLLEANFRSPAVAQLIGFDPPVCLTEQLEIHRSRLTAPWDVVETAVPWLHVAAVAPGVETRPLLDGRALAICIEQLRHAGYDHLVVDSPAILDGADVNVAEQSVDAIVIALRTRLSRAQPFRTAVEQIGSGKLLGVVLLHG